MEPLILAIIFSSFFVTYLAMPFWMRKTKQIGLVWRDMHKLNKEKRVAGSGGLIVLFGFALGVLLYIALKTFYFGVNGETNSYILALLSVIFISAMVGLIDDLFGWQKGGLSRRSRIALIFFASIPLMVINAGVSIVNIPFFGNVDFGFFYALLIVPIGVLGATTTYNFLAGYNGLEASQGIIILSSLALVTYLTGNSWLSVISLIAVFSLLAFYVFNKYPAEVFPGDVLTYQIGALIAGIAILGDIERIAVFFFIPYIIETILKSRGKLKKESFGKLNSDGSLEMPYDKVYGLEHLAIKILKRFKPTGKVYEKEVVYFINGFQILVIVIGFLVFF